MDMGQRLTCVELCAGGGGSSLGLEQAGFLHEAVVEVNPTYCETLERNRPEWSVACCDLADFDARHLSGVDLLSGGLPCPPFSIAGRQMGADDERNCFPHAIRIAKEVRPKAIMFENVPGLLQRRFEPYRDWITQELEKLGYACRWFRVVSAEHGVPQYRPRTILIGAHGFAAIPDMPTEDMAKVLTVSDALRDIMGANGWHGLDGWIKMANSIAPTITGGSEKHGGPDLGPTRARRAWAKMGIDGLGIADNPPTAEFEGMPRLTLRMVARLQAFPDEWEFVGTKTRQHRQIGNALPPPVACAVGRFLRRIIGP